MHIYQVKRPRQKLLTICEVQEVCKPVVSLDMKFSVPSSKAVLDSERNRRRYEEAHACTSRSHSYLPRHWLSEFYICCTYDGTGGSRLMWRSVLEWPEGRPHAPESSNYKFVVSVILYDVLMWARYSSSADLLGSHMMLSACASS